MLLPRIQLVRNKRPTRLPQDPLLGQLSRFRVIADLHAGREGVDVFHEGMVEEGDTTFDGVRHLSPVGQIGEEHVGESGLVPDVQGGMQGMPLGADEAADTDIDVLDDGDLR